MASACDVYVLHICVVLVCVYNISEWVWSLELYSSGLKWVWSLDFAIKCHSDQAVGGKGTESL